MKQTAIIIATLLLLASCGNGRPNLDDRVFGTWTEDTTDVMYPTQDVITLNDDGTFTAFYPAYDKEAGYKDINDQGTYTTKDVANPKKWKFGACVVVLESDYGNDFELEFHFDEDGMGADITYYEIHTSRDGVRTVDDRIYDFGVYKRKK